jgi:hypothetical protein
MIENAVIVPATAGQDSEKVKLEYLGQTYKRENGDRLDLTI